MKEYKPIFVDPDTHYKVKVQAVKNRTRMSDLVQKWASQEQENA